MCGAVGAPASCAMGNPHMIEGESMELAVVFPGFTNPVLSSTRHVPKLRRLSLLLTVTCHSNAEGSKTDAMTASTGMARAVETWSAQLRMRSKTSFPASSEVKSGSGSGVGVGSGGTSGVAGGAGVARGPDTGVGCKTAGVSLPPPMTLHAPAKRATTTIASIAVGLERERMTFLRVPCKFLGLLPMPKGQSRNTGSPKRCQCFY